MSTATATANPQLAEQLAEVKALVEEFRANKGPFAAGFVRKQEQDHAVLLDEVKRGQVSLRDAWGKDAEIRNRIGTAHIVLIQAAREGLIDNKEYNNMRIQLNQLADTGSKTLHINERVWDRELEAAGKQAAAPVPPTA